MDKYVPSLGWEELKPVNFFPLKRFFNTVFSFFVAFAICILVLEKAPGNRREYDSVKHFEKAFSPPKTEIKKDFLPVMFSQIFQYSQGNFGTSLTFNAPVSEVLSRFAKVSFLYWITSLLLTMILGIFFGFALTQVKYGFVSVSIKMLLLFFYRTPTFLIGIFLLYLANRYLPAGFFRMEEMSQHGFKLGLILSHLWIPVLCYLTFTLSSFVFEIESWINEENEKEYLTALRARGFTELTIFAKHILPNIFQLLLASFPLTVRNLVILSVAIEVTFQVHGFGYLSHLIFQTRDTPLLLFTFVSICLVEMCLIFSCDLLVVLFSRKGRGNSYV